MQCDFSMAELIRLNLATLDRTAKMKNILENIDKREASLIKKDIELLEKLQAKLGALIDGYTDEPSQRSE